LQRTTPGGRESGRHGACELYWVDTGPVLNAMPKHIIGPNEKPPLGLMGGSVHDYERGKDPFSRECMPSEFQHHFPDKPVASGWLALDYWGNIIGFAQDGDIINL